MDGSNTKNEKSEKGIEEKVQEETETKINGAFTGDLVEVKYLAVEPREGRANLLEDTRNSGGEEEESRSGLDTSSFLNNKHKKRGIRLNESRSCFCCGVQQKNNNKCF